MAVDFAPNSSAVSATASTPTSPRVAVAAAPRPFREHGRRFQPNGINSDITASRHRCRPRLEAAAPAADLTEAATAAVLDSKPRHPRPICLKPRHPRPILSKPRHPRQVRPKPRRGSVEVAITRSRATRGQFVDAHAEPPPMTLFVISADPSTPARRRRL
ncbi:uncharacterized protein LOC109704361 [Ananas comosus]|uniref:Uncharacterized protein LOC109704361 n=1 Tax=Ananas comosus TaxID=4615 RepID=A0A6P5EBJ2_ANACO|nr:uncharacterized protein LOC109704361 [Ananas comosus]